MDEMNKILDQIMKLNHEVAGYYIKMAEMEILRKPEDKLLQIAVNTKMESIRKLYLQLGAEMQESGMERTRNWYENFNIAVKQEPNKVEDNIIVDIRENILEYIKSSYLDINFTSDVESDVISIYDGTKEEIIRQTEYETYASNIASLENRADIDAEKIEDLGFTPISDIIEDLSDNIMYKKAAGKLSDIIEKLENGEYKFNSKAEQERIRATLIYMKYDEMYKATNQKTNGLIENSVHKPIIDVAQKSDSAYILFGLSKEDFERLYKSRVYEYLEDTKNNVKDVFRMGRDNELENRKQRKNPLKNIGEGVTNLLKAKTQNKTTPTAPTTPGGESR